MAKTIYDDRIEATAATTKTIYDNRIEATAATTKQQQRQRSNSSDDATMTMKQRQRSNSSDDGTMMTKQRQCDDDDEARGWTMTTKLVVGRRGWHDSNLVVVSGVGISVILRSWSTDSVG